jgi:hypothetical protein
LRKCFAGPVDKLFPTTVHINPLALQVGSAAPTQTQSGLPPIARY